MGRPYQSEMAKLAMTYAWSMSHSARPLSQIIDRFAAGSALCVGSGGSYSAAVLCAEVLESATGKLAVARTPLEIEAIRIPETTSVWLLSGSGRNVDIRRALRIAARQIDRQIVIVCAKTDSPLEREARELGVTSIFSFDSPAGKDGFLATNSLLSTSVLLTRAADCALNTTTPLPDTLPALYRTFAADAEARRTIGAAAEAMSKASYNVVLHGPAGRVGAVDLESKFIEAAFSPLAPSDYRNFAHGRHNWLNRFADSTFVLALVGDNERRLADRTLDLLPKEVGQARLALPSASNAARIAALLIAFEITATAGAALGLDPGRPKIPEFGRKLYRVRTGLSQPSRTPALDPAVQRKLSAVDSGAGASSSQRTNYVRSHEEFVDRLEAASIRAVVFDYDGTLVATDDRYSPPSPRIAAELNRLLTAGLTIGIATGRGDSVLEPVRQVLKPSLYKKVRIGYHNGAASHRLDELPAETSDEVPKKSNLATLQQRLREKLPFLAIDEIRGDRHQLSLRGCSAAELKRVWSMTNELIAAEGFDDLKVLMSGHSVDVLDKGVSKHGVLNQLADDLEVDHGQILCIGDSGYWPGNDHELLLSPLSLSVDRVSVNPDSCWNLLPPRVTHVDGTLHYLIRLDADKGQARMRP